MNIINKIIPRKLNLALRYYKNTKHFLNFTNPKRYTEKLQLYKLEENFPLMGKCHDKYTVHEYVKEKGYGDILVPIYQVAQHSSELDFASLPDKFVMKTTNSGNTNIFCYDKSSFDWEDALKKLDTWAQMDVVNQTLQYSLNAKAHIIVEKMLERDSDNDLIDYRMFCFNGKVFCTCVTTDYVDCHENGRMGFMDRDWNLMPYNRKEFKPLKGVPVKPKNYERMLEIAENLSAPFPHCRIDLYNVDGNINFGEMTFITMGGFCGFTPDEFDFILGEQFDYYRKEKGHNK